LGLHGSFTQWDSGDDERRDERLGIRTSTTLKLGDRLFVKDENGAVRELLGIEKRRQVTEDFLGSSSFTSEPQYSQSAGTATLPDGRHVDLLEVTPPGGEPYRVAIDRATGLIVQIGYEEADALETTTMRDQRVVDGMLVPFVSVQSNGDTTYDVTTTVTTVDPHATIDPARFAPLRADDVVAPAPVTVHFDERDGLVIVPVQIGAQTYHFLLDSGSQSDVLDTALAKSLHLAVQGLLEVTGAQRTGSNGVAELDGLSIGGVAMPMHIVTVLDLSGVLRTGRVDGILGYPLFAAASVRIDPSAHTLTIASPGALAAQGDKLDIDTDRELADAQVRIDGTPARVLVDTGDANELLLFEHFVRAQLGVAALLAGHEQRGLGIGGSIPTRSATIDDLQIGRYHLYRRRAVLVLAQHGAFADRNDDGNIGYGTLRNFVSTWDLPDHAIYVTPARGFDDGRFR
jgi:hypothetical protein